jgi:PilZ domain
MPQTVRLVIAQHTPLIAAPATGMEQAPAISGFAPIRKALCVRMRYSSGHLQAFIQDVRMEPLRELRVRMQLEVRLWGMDSAGKPFSQTARTVEISGNGARLEGVASLKAGEVIGVQHANQKARFRVAWTGETGTAEAGQIGIVSVEPGKCIWWQALQNTNGEVGGGQSLNAASATLPPTTSDSPGQQERRRYSRHQCKGKVLLRKEGTDAFASAKLTDISLGGCYAETFSPFPLETPVQLVIRADELEIRGCGLVRTVHPSMGNGIAFTQLAADDWRRLNELIARVSRAARNVPVQTVHKVEACISPVLEVLLQLLEKKGILTRDEFLSELGRSGLQ